MKTKQIGVIGVDSGLVWIGDPCYIHKDKKELPKEWGKDWSEFIKRIKGNHQQFNYDLDHAGLGVLVSSYGGDGVYPVIAELDSEGRVERVTIDFMKEPEGDE